MRAYCLVPLSSKLNPSPIRPFLNAVLQLYELTLLVFTHINGIKERLVYFVRLGRFL